MVNRKRPNQWLVAAVVMISLGTVIAFRFHLQRTAPATQIFVAPTAPVTSAIPAPMKEATKLLPPHAEQVAFLHSQLFPAWDHIRAYYPITNLRQDFDRFMQRTQGGDVKLHARVRYYELGPAPARAYQENGQLKVDLYLPMWMEIWSEINERETIADVVVGVMLHEQFHLDHHHQPNNAQQAQANEVEAWWYSVEQCYAPMKKAGRLTHLPADQSIIYALTAYELARGDRRHPAWQSFCRSVTSPGR